MYQLSIQAACGLSWPTDRLIVQVLDDSTDQTIKVVQLNELIKLFHFSRFTVRDLFQGMEFSSLVCTCPCEIKKTRLFD